MRAERLKLGKVRYAFIDVHRPQHPVRVLCKMRRVHPSGLFA